MYFRNMIKFSKHIIFKIGLICLLVLGTFTAAQPSYAESFQQKTEQTQQQKKKQQQKRKQQKNKKQRQNKAQKNKQKQAQEKKKAKQDAEKNAPIKSSPIREEIQRYMGYEPILAERYITIPYDISMNTNMQGGFVDIGYFIFMFLPVIFLLGFVRRPLYGFSIMVFSILLLSISTSSSFSVKRGIEAENIPPNIDTFINAVKFSDYPVSVTCAKVYKGLHKIYMPIYRGMENISGKRDYVTYPILASLFVLFFFILQKRLHQMDKYKKSIINFLYLFSFIWLILACGIIWYGYLMLVLGLAIVVAALTNNGQQSWIRRGTLGMFVASALIWIVIGYVYRISNHRPVTPDSAKLLFDIPSVKYQTGVFDRKDVVNTLLPGAEKALEEINEDENALVYRVGTFFPYLIYKNDKRVLQDNQLGFFQNLIQKIPHPISLAEALKASGYRYILVDLNTPSIDKTPEKSLQRKFMSFMVFLFGNDKLELLATDRVITLTPPDDPNPIYTHGVFGNIHNPGTYAIYKVK